MAPETCYRLTAFTGIPVIGKQSALFSSIGFPGGYTADCLSRLCLADSKAS